MPLCAGCCCVARDELADERYYSQYLDDDARDLDEARGAAAADPPLELALGDFAPVRILGVGAHARVVLVRAPGGQSYAMKLASDDPTGARRAIVERRVLQRLRHPFVARLHSSVATPSSIALVLEFYPGGELYDHLRREGFFSLARSCLYTAEVLLAVQALHAADVAYRDLKPENILLDAQGHAVVSDFGLAREGISRLPDGARSLCGSPAYMAPEVLSGAGHGTAVDYWALGTLLFEMLTGVPPFYHRDPHRMSRAILYDEPAYPRHLKWPARALLRTLLQRDPARRAGSPEAGGPAKVRRARFFRRLDFERVLRRGYTPVFEPRPDAEAAAGEGDLDLLDLEELVARQAAQAGALSPLMWRGGGGAGRWSGPPPRTVEAEETNEQTRIS